MVILIPARGGSKRIPGKALRHLAGKPLIDWTIERCLEVVDHTRIVVCSEDADILAHAAPAVEIWRRPLWTATDDAPDITWLSLALARWPEAQRFVVRRPTSPFLSAATLERALHDVEQDPRATALRAMRPVSDHPNKMWMRRGVGMVPLINPTKWNEDMGNEAWSTPTQMLRRVYVQTAGLEIIRRATLEAGSLTGTRVLPLFLEGREAIDLNTPADWFLAESLLKDDEGGDDV